VFAVDVSFVELELMTLGVDSVDNDTGVAIFLGVDTRGVTV